MSTLNYLLSIGDTMRNFDANTNSYIVNPYKTRFNIE